MTVIFFAGPRLDHGDADQASDSEADYLERRDARPPVVVRGYGVSGQPVSVIRAGQRIATGARTAAKDLPGFSSSDSRIFWLILARNARGESVTGRADCVVSGNSQYPPPFSFRPERVIPAPNGHLFCLAAPVGHYVTDQGGWYWPGWFQEFFRVYRRNGDWMRDFPELHGGRIFDLKIDGDGNIFIAGAEVGEDRYSFRKYSSAGALQWSVGFAAYDRPLSPAFTYTNRRRYATHIDIGGDGSLYVVGLWSYDLTYSDGVTKEVIDRYCISRISSAGVISWVRFLFPLEPAYPLTRDLLSFKAISDRIVIFFRGFIGRNLVVGKTSGSYAAADFVDLAAPILPNGLIFSATGDFSGFAFSPTTHEEVINQCVMRYANERLYVQGVRFAGGYQYFRYVFYNDLSVLSATEIAAFDVTEAFAVSESGTGYYGKRIKRDHGPGTLAGQPRPLACATHFRAVNAEGDPLWDTLAASGLTGVNAHGRPWRDYGFDRGNTPWTSRPGGSTPAEYQAFHDALVVYTRENGQQASADLVGLGEGTGTPKDFWLPATDVAIAYDSPTPPLALPVFLRAARLIGPVTTLPPGLALPFALRAPFLRREYAGPPLPHVHRLTLGDLEIPFSTLIARKTVFETTVSAICPAASEPLVAAILARDTDLLIVWRGVRFPDGTEQLEPLLRGALAGIRYDRGARSGSITLDVRQEPDATPARTRTLSAVSRRAARSWSSPLPDTFLNPGDTAVVGAIHFTVARVEYLISPNEARMTVGEAE